MQLYYRFLNAPNLITLTGLLLALASIQLATKGLLNFAMMGLMLSGLCDLFDGMVARKTVLSPEEARFGAVLDTLNDVVCFGALPVVIWAVWFNSFWIYSVLAVYLLATLLRLAYFELYGTQQQGQTAYYTGLPVTYAALVLPVGGLLGMFMPPGLQGAWLLALPLLLAGLYLLNRPIPKPAGKAYLVFPVLTLLAMVLWAWQPWIAPH